LAHSYVGKLAAKAPFTPMNIASYACRLDYIKKKPGDKHQCH